MYYLPEVAFNNKPELIFYLRGKATIVNHLKYFYFNYIQSYITFVRQI